MADRWTYKEDMVLDQGAFSVLVARDSPSLRELVAAANAAERYREALAKITEGRGAFDLDRLTHASNCIADMKAIAVAALADQEATS